MSRSLLVMKQVGAQFSTPCDASKRTGNAKVAGASTSAIIIITKQGHAARDKARVLITLYIPVAFFLYKVSTQI